MAWCALADAIPLYPLYALLFADSGLSDAEISALFIIWSVVGMVCEVPAGALADRVSRRGALVAAGVLQAACHLLWVVQPDFAGFAAGFVLWGIGGALGSGAFAALLFEGLTAAGAGHRYGPVTARADAAALLVQVPVAGAASLLAAVGGYTAAGLVSVAVCLAAAALAAGLPDVRPAHGGDGDEDEDGDERGYMETLRAGLGEVARVGAVRAAVAAAAILFAFDGLEEFHPLLAEDWGVPGDLIPVALLVIPLVGAAGAALGGRLVRASPLVLGALLGAGAVALALAAILA
ncbi:MAG: MFS transporter, partial [Thermoleophilia bacterium]